MPEVLSQSVAPGAQCLASVKLSKRGRRGYKITNTDKMKETELFMKMDAEKNIDTKEKLV